MATPVHLLVGVSPQIARLRAWLDKVAASDASVLISGETGTGKECVAHYLHEHSPRAEKPIACINCSALPEGLIESELFGHERGAFTGAYQSERGRIRDAGRHLVPGEIGDMPNAAQAKILRVLENREVTPWAVAVANPSTCASSRPPMWSHARCSLTIACVATSSTG